MVTQREKDLERALKLAVGELRELAPYLEGYVFGTWESSTEHAAAILDGATAKEVFAFPLAS